MLLRHSSLHLTITLVLGLAASGQSDAAVLCGRKNLRTGMLAEGATLRVRTACKTSEVQVAPSDVGFGAPSVTVRTGNTISTNGSLSTPALCDEGEVATGGGWLGSASGGAELTVQSSRPFPDTAGSVPNAWRINAANLSSGTGLITITAYAVCAAP